jgi:predicted DNA-binding protein (UPF0251 family)
MNESRTQYALRLLRENPGMSQYRACKLAGLSQSVLSRAVSALRQKVKHAAAQQN